VEGFCKRCNEPSGIIRSREYLDQLSEGPFFMEFFLHFTGITNIYVYVCYNLLRSFSLFQVCDVILLTSHHSVHFTSSICNR